MVKMNWTSFHHHHVKLGGRQCHSWSLGKSLLVIIVLINIGLSFGQDARTDYVFRGGFRRQDSSPYQPAINHGTFQRYYQPVPDTESASSLAYAPSSGTISRVQHTPSYGGSPLTGPPRSFQQTVTGPLTPPRSRSILLPNYLSRQPPTNANQAPAALVSNAQDYIYEYSDESEPSGFNKSPPQYEEVDNKSQPSPTPSSVVSSRRPASLQSLQSQRPSGRSVAPASGSRGKGNSLPVRPLNALLRPTVPSTQASNNQESSVLPSNNISNISSATNSRKAALAALAKPSKRPAILRGTNRLTSSTTAKSAEDLLVQSPSSTLRPSPSVFLKPSHRFQPSPGVSRGTPQGTSSTPASKSKDKEEEDDDTYTVEYIEYVEGDEEDGGSKGTGGDEDKSEYEFIELSEEATKKVLANETLVRHSAVAKGKKPEVPEKKTTSSVSSSSSGGKSKFASESSRPNITTSPFVHSEEDEEEDERKGQVVISVATTKSVQKKDEGGEFSGSSSTETPARLRVTPTPTQRVTYSQVTGGSVVKSSVQTSRSISNFSPNRRPSTVRTTTVASIKATPSTPEVVKDSIPSGAENAPEYFEEEYSYPDNHPNFMNEAIDGDSSSSTTSATFPERSSDENLYRKSVESFFKPKGNEEGTQENQAFEPKNDQLESLVVNQNKAEVDEEDEDDEEEEESPPPVEKTEERKSIEFVKPKIQFEEILPPGLLPVGFSPPPPEEPSTTSTTTTSTTTTTTTSTTTTTPAPSTTTSSSAKPISFDDIPADFLPKGYRKLLGSRASTTTSAPEDVSSSTTSAPPSAPRSFGGLAGLSIPLDDLSQLLPKDYKPFKVPTEPTSSTTQAPSTTTKSLFPKIKFQEISLADFLPPGFKVPSSPETEEPPKIVPVSIFPKNLLPSNFSGPSVAPITVNAPANLLPPGFKFPSTSQDTPSNLLPPGFKFPDSSPPETPANLLPPGFKFPGSVKNASGPTTASPLSTTKKPGGVVFPTKSGGFRVTRPTTTEGPKADTPPPPRVTISGGWPTRKTTDFTGWPTVSTVKSIIPSTTPFVIPTPAETTTTTTKPTTTTTTPPPPPRGEPKICPKELCRMSATLRITSGVEWKPELGDKNTEEYKHLEVTLKRTLDGTYRASGLAPWYKRVQIEGFNSSRGIFLVDYNLELEKVNKEVTTADVLQSFHKKLLDADPSPSANDEVAYPDADPMAHVPSESSLTFGRFTIDPRYTDFIVMTSRTTTNDAHSQPDGILPPWAIAVAVLGVVSVVIILILGISVLINRHKKSGKKNNASLTQDMLNQFNNINMGGRGGEKYGADGLYNMDAVWNDEQNFRTFDRRPTKRSQGSSHVGLPPNYNIYDSWKTEWNGYAENSRNPNSNSSNFMDAEYLPSRRRADYDPDF